MIIGAVGGLLVVMSVLTFDRLKVDDPVGALSVHLTNGIWGTLAVGLFSNPGAVGYEAGETGPLAGLFAGGDVTQLKYQVVGVLAVGAFTFVVSMVIWLAIKAIIGLRVEPDVEIQGLDRGEMGMEAYADDITH